MQLVRVQVPPEFAIRARELANSRWNVRGIPLPRKNPIRCGQPPELGAAAGGQQRTSIEVW